MYHEQTGPQNQRIQHTYSKSGPIAFVGYFNFGVVIFWVISQIQITNAEMCDACTPVKVTDSSNLKICGFLVL